MTKSEESQMERIRKREEAQQVRERELILSGKLKPDNDYLKNDKFSQLHKQMEDIKTFHKKKSVNVKRKPSTKVRWQYVVHKLHINTDTNGDGKTNHSEPETAVEGLKLEPKKENVKPVTKRANPIYSAFENVYDVDDLYRIADSLVNSTFEE